MEAMEPVVDVKFSEFVKQLDNSFQQKKRKGWKEIEDDVSQQVAAYRGNFRRYLDDNWSILFPGENKDLVKIEQELDNFLVRKAQEIFQDLKKQLIRQQAYRTLLGFVYERQFFNLLFVGLGTLVLFPLSLFLVFVQSDLAMYAGIAGVFIFPIINVVTLVKYIAWRKEKTK